MKSLLNLKKFIEDNGLTQKTLNEYIKIMETVNPERIKNLSNSALNHIDAELCLIFEKEFDPHYRLR